MTGPQFVAEVGRRIGISEGDRLVRYFDSKGIATIGRGFNLERGDAREALAKCGVTDIDGVINGTASITTQQDDALFQYSFGPIQDEARASLAPGVYDSMTDARRFVICDLVFNMGPGSDGWGGFVGTRSILNQAQQAKNAGGADAHELFEAAADHLANSAWFVQVGDRARRNVAMIRSGVWVNAYGNGTY